MGTGKSAVGLALAEKLGKQFIEVDALIEKKAGKSITAIFTDSGEIAFRELEIETIKEISSTGNAVIACGGGVALNHININRLKEESVIVWLKASPGTILKRTQADEVGRPLLAGIKNITEIKSMLRFRDPFYRASADIIIDTTRLNIDSVVDQIIVKLKEYENQGQSQ
jgi:shikimate kinase